MNANISIVWVSRAPEAHLANDPLIGFLEHCATIEKIDAGEPVDVLVRRVESAVQSALEKGIRPAIIIDAFLEPAREGVDDGKWQPERPYLERLTGMVGTDRLKSLRLMWALWLRLRNAVPIMITTNGIGLSMDSKSALQSAFSSGAASMVYSWKSNRSQLDGIARRVLR